MRSVGTQTLWCSPLPGHEVRGMGKKDTIGNEAEDDNSETIHKD